MVFGGARPGDEWSLSGQKVPIVKDYKYLGIRFVGGSGLRPLARPWAVQREKMLRKARGAFWQAWGMGMGGGHLSAKGAAGLWETLVRPVLEYGGVVDSGLWIQAEHLQIMAGRMSLGVSTDIPEEVVRGELGWWRVRTRREYLRLVYWGRIVRGKGTIVEAAYRQGRRRVQLGTARKAEWAARTKAVLDRIGLATVWASEDVGTDREWKRMVRRLLHLDEEICWRHSMMRKSSLAGYCRLQQDLRKGWFLSNHRAWVSRWVRLRAGVGVIEAHRGRFSRTARCHRVCRFCSDGVEDLFHLLDGCSRWRDHRSRLWQLVETADPGARSRAMTWSRTGRIVWLLRGGSVRTRDAVLKVVGGWYREREVVGRNNKADAARRSAPARRPVRLIMRKRCRSSLENIPSKRMCLPRDEA